MPSVSDTELAYLKTLGNPPGSLADLRWAYLDDRCRTPGGAAVGPMPASLADMYWRVGMDPDQPVLSPAQRDVQNLYTNNKTIDTVGAFVNSGIPGSSASTMTVVPDGTAPVPSTNVLNMLATANGTQNGCSFRHSIPGRVTVVPGKIYTVSAYAKWISGPLKQVRLNATWYSGGAIIEGNNFSQPKTISSSGWTRVVNNDNFCTPDNVYHLDIRGNIYNPAIGDEVRWCGFMCELGNWDETMVGAYE